MPSQAPPELSTSTAPKGAMPRWSATGGLVPEKAEYRLYLPLSAEDSRDIIAFLKLL